MCCYHIMSSYHYCFLFAVKDMIINYANCKIVPAGLGAHHMDHNVLVVVVVLVLYGPP